MPSTEVRVRVAMMAAVAAMAACRAAQERSGSGEGAAAKVAQRDAGRDAAPAVAKAPASPLPTHAVARLGYAPWNHGGRVMAVAQSRDGATMASGGWGDQVVIWDVATGAARTATTITGTRGVFSLAFAPDGDRLVVGAEGAVVIVDAADGAVLRRIEIDSGSQVHSVAFSPDGREIAYDRIDAHVVDVASGEARWSVPSPARHGASAIAFRPDGSLIVAFGDDLMVVPAGGGAATTTATLDVDALALSADGAVVAANLGRLEVVTLDPKTLAVVTRFALPAVADDDRISVGGIAVSTDGALVVAGTNHGLYIWKTADGALLRTIDGGLGAIHGVVVASDGVISIADRRPVIRRFAIDTGEELPAGDVVGHGTTITGVAFTGSGEVLSAGVDGTLRRWDLAAGKETQVVEVGAPVSAIAVAPDGATVAVAAAGDVVAWSLPGLERGKALAPGGRPVSSLDWKRRLVVGRIDGSACVADDAAGCAPGFDVGRELHAVAMSPDGKTVAVGLFSPTLEPVELRAADDGAVQARPAVESNQVNRMCWTEAGALLALAHQGMVHAIDPDGTVRANVAGTPLGEGLALACAPGGGFATGEADGVVRLWTADGKLAGERRGHRGAIIALAYSASGAQIASGSLDGTVLVWTVDP